jgi:predicted ATPase
VADVIRTPDQRVRVFVSSTLGELAEERLSVRAAVQDLRLTPVMFELGARPHPPRELYRAYLEQSDVFVGVYGERYGWTAPGEHVSGLEDEYRLSGERPKLIYVKADAPERDVRLAALLDDVRDDDQVSYKHYGDADELRRLVADDLALLMSERFERPATSEAPQGELPGPPLPPSPTIGRDHARDQVVRLLRAEHLVMLVGPGGVGKSRLAAEAARRWEAGGGGAVCWTSLAPVVEPDLALRTIAEALGARVEGTRSLVQTLVEHLGARSLLLVLDNLEQVLGVGTSLAEVLASCPGLRVLATSREPLGIRAERVVPVAPLAVDRGAETAGEHADAVELFLDRARAAAAGYEPVGEELDAVGELCRRLDGLPLAIELAAARARFLPPSVMLDRLSGGLDLPAAPGGDRPDRQRTLRATLEWSHDLLSAEEARVFAAFAAFEGGAVLGAAELVCGDGDAPVLDTLMSLADKSLLRIEPGPDLEPRLSMLETVRAFAAERLDVGDDADEVRLRHRECYRMFAWEAHPYLCGRGQREWAARLDAERADLRRAVRTSLDRGEVLPVVELAWGVYVYFWIRDAEAEPGSWLEAAAPRVAELSRVGQAELRSLLALNRNSKGEFHRTEDDLVWSLDVFRDEGMDFMAAVALKELGTVRYVADEAPERAVAALEQSSALFERVDHDWGVALAETMLGTMLAVSGDLPGGEVHHLRSLERSRAIDSDQLVVQALHQLAMVRVLEDRPHEAVELVREAATVVVREGFQVPATACLDVLGAAAVRLGDVAVGVGALLTASEVRGRLGAAPWPTIARFVDAMTAEAVAQLDEPERLVQEERAQRDPVLVLQQVLGRVVRAAQGAG